jgi:single-strand DNA-binding protein
MLNRVILIGRLVADPELRYTPSGLPVASMRIAVDRIRSKEATERQTDFINLVAWRQQAEFAANYLGKGRLIAVDGRLQIRQWQTQDGQKRTSAEVVVERIQSLERAREAGAQPPSDEGAPPERVSVSEEPDIPGPWEDE